jgi:hypothetical protein
VSLGSPGFRRHRRAASSMSLLHTPWFIRETMAKVVVASFEQEVNIYGCKLRDRKLEKRKYEILAQKNVPGSSMFTV